MEDGRKRMQAGGGGENEREKEEGKMSEKQIEERTDVYRLIEPFERCRDNRENVFVRLREDLSLKRFYVNYEITSARLLTRRLMKPLLHVDYGLHKLRVKRYKFLVPIINFLRRIKIILI